MWKPSGGNLKCKAGESNNSKKASTRNFSILAMIKQHFSSTLDDLSSSWRRRTSWRSQTCRTGRTTCVSSKLKNPVTTQHASGHDTGFSSAQGQKNPELRRVESRQSERPLGRKNLVDSPEVQSIRTSGGSWHHSIRARNRQTEEGKRKHPFQREHGDPQQDEKADRVGDLSLHPPRCHEVHGWPARRDPHRSTGKQHRTG